MPEEAPLSATFPRAFRLVALPGRLPARIWNKGYKEKNRDGYPKHFSQMRRHALFYNHLAMDPGVLVYSRHTARLEMCQAQAEERLDVRGPFQFRFGGQMRNPGLKVLLSVGALLCFATGAFADPTVTMKLIAPPDGPSMAGVYTSPYTALINGVQTLVICDDYLTDVSVNTPAWQATVTNLADLQGESAPSTAVKFDTTATATQQLQDYVAVAYLAQKLMTIDQSTTAGQILAGEYSFAIWGVFDPPALSTLTGSTKSVASGLLSTALGIAASQNLNDLSAYANVTIYTPVPTGASQEYLTVRMVEPSFIILMLVDLLAVFGLVCFLRKRGMALSF